MVRLKVDCQPCSELCYSISIPYGAIKRQLLGITLNLIIIFQFLMVRLKGSNYFNISDTCKISIPYGAIKSIKLYNVS